MISYERTAGSTDELVLGFADAGEEDLRDVKLNEAIDPAAEDRASMKV
jgi:hypothetical protein